MLLDWKCDDQVTVDGAGYITSPRYPNPYPFYANCRTLLTAPTGTRIVLELVYFDRSLCKFGHTFAIYDGASESSELLVSCTGGVPEPQTLVSSSQESLLIVFTSNAVPTSSSKPGYNLTYYFEGL